jgi:dihydroxy-acid dehydratase
MAIAFEFLGISPMGRNGVPAMDQRKDDVAFDCGKMVMNLLKRDLRPRQIITRKSLENAIAAVATTGGSTNAVLHLLAIAREAGITLSIDDFDTINRRCRCSPT